MGIKRVLIIFSAIAYVLFPSTSFAGSAGSSYAGIQYGMVTYSETGIPDFEPTALAGRLGYFVHDQFSIEGRIGIGISDDSAVVDVGFGPENVSLEVDSLVGIYGVAHLPLSDNASLYGVIGFTQGELTVKVSGIPFSGDDDDLSYGIGVDFGVGQKTSVNIEYMSYLDETAYDVTAIALGVNFAF